LKTYEKSLNASDATLAASCYAKDGMFMPSTLPTAQGDGMRDAYVKTFEAIRLAVKFTIDELVVVSDAIAYGLTRSHGTQTILSTGKESLESNRELFIFRRENGAWKIARYIFNKPE
jgi:ketosteroid isomerase-like protein